MPEPFAEISQWSEHDVAGHKARDQHYSLAIAVINVRAPMLNQKAPEKERRFGGKAKFQ